MSSQISLETIGHLISQKPYYLKTRDEVRMFEAAFDARLPVMLKGPTGCGKTRFVEYMSA
jgi:nitric oxide reductase NorQ protein